MEWQLGFKTEKIFHHGNGMVHKWKRVGCSKGIERMFFFSSVHMFPEKQKCCHNQALKPKQDNKKMGSAEISAKIK